jgi:ribonuclease T2
MKLAVLPLVAALLLTLAACKSAPNASPAAERAAGATQPRLAAATGFDFYLLNLSWSPEYCHSHPEAAECARRSTFVLHGLWPQNNDGSYPQNCGNGPNSQSGPDASQFSDIYPEPGLLEHEWRTHGTCSGLAANDFFSAARSAYQSVRIPDQLANLNSQTSLPPYQIAALFTQANPSLTRESIAISCGNNYLTAVEICLNKSLHPIACPAVRSCRANSVRIAPPR